tara:strand:- start:13889 stop:14389 length:501 start_codon:yes stop_codon:yes gene_type:complete
MKKLSLLALLVVLMGLEAQAQLKIAYTNPELILSNLPEVEAIDKEIGMLLAEKDSLLAIKAQSYQNQIDNLTSQSLSQSELTAKADSISQEFEAERQKSINEVQQKQVSLLQPVEEKVFETIKIVADSLGLDLVLNEGSINGGAFIFYASEEQIDITELVIEKIKK